MALFGFGDKTKIGVKVGDIMTRNFVSVKPDTSLIECAKEMIKKHVGSLVVKEMQSLKGILTEKDVVWAVVKKQDLSKIKAKDIMTRRVVTINPSKDIYEAISRMSNTKIRVLPVVVKDKVIGVVTMKDILRLEPSLFDIVTRSIEIREENAKLNRRKAALSGETETWIKEGVCSECGAYGLLYNIDGKLLCESCKDEL
jgi:signal-transduction protein with cAMP-binding, CBS, and nucleotidyltransferase domain